MTIDVATAAKTMMKIKAILFIFIRTPPFTFGRKLFDFSPIIKFCVIVRAYGFAFSH